MSSSHLKELDYPNLETITDNGQYPTYNSQFGSSVLERVSLPKLKSTTGCLFQGGVLPTEVELPALETATRGVLQGVSGIKRLLCPELKTCNGYSYNPNLLNGCADLEYAYIPKLESYTVYGSGDGAGSLQDMPNLEHLVIGRAPFISSSQYVRYALDNCPKLILLDIRGDLNVNIYLDHWIPTLTDSDVLSQFLSNFRTYIALRLTDNGSGKTLTLSAAVFSSIWDANGNPQVLQDGLDQLRADIHNIVKTTKHWDVNKAN
jgi:hypothetical protein